MNKTEYLKKFAEKLSISFEQVESEFNEILKEEKEIHKDLPFEQQEMRALKRLSLVYKKQMRSPAVGFEGIIIAASDSVDIVAKQKREALEQYKNDPQNAIMEGVTDEEGTPLDTRATWSTGNANPRFGKPLPEHNYLRNIWVIATLAKSEESPKLYQMILSGDKANDELPIFKPTRFMAIDKGDKLNASTFTNFVVDETLNLPKINELVLQFLDKTKLSELESYHNLNKDDFNRLVVVEGDVSMLNLEPTSFGSRVLVLEDSEASLEDLESKSLTCWVGENIDIDFAEGSKIMVIGRTSQGNKKDAEGNKTEELADVTMNAFGVYALPDFKIELPKDIEPLTEENLE